MDPQGSQQGVVWGVGVWVLVRGVEVVWVCVAPLHATRSDLDKGCGVGG